MAAGPARAQAAGDWSGPDEMFAKTCGYCHNTHVAAAIRGRDLSPEYIESVVRSGTLTMPAFRPSEFTNAELSALAKMIAESDPPENTANGDDQ